MSLKRYSFSSLGSFQRSLVSAVLALIGYGAWAYLVNSMHGFVSAIKAACVQGSYSFALTFVMTVLIEVLYRWAAKLSDTEMLIKGLTIVITCSIIFSASWWVNALAGTPEIFNTVILGYVIGGAFTIVYVFSLQGEKTLKQSNQT